MVAQSTYKTGPTTKAARLMENGQQPNLKETGIQLLECMLIPAVVTVALAIMMCVLWRGWKKRRAAKKRIDGSVLLEEGLPSLRETPPSTEVDAEAFHFVRFTSGWFRQPDVNGSLTVSVLPNVSVIDFAFAPPPPTPQLRGREGADDMEEIDLGEPALSR